MRFTEVQAVVPNSRMWASKSGRWSFVIMQEMDPQVGSEWIGYTATWKDMTSDMRPFGLRAADLRRLGATAGTQPLNRIGGVFATFAEAEDACSVVLRALKMGLH